MAIFRILAILCLVAAPAFGNLFGGFANFIENLIDSKKANLRLTFSLNLLTFGSDAFVEMPITTDAATKAGWVQVDNKPESPAGLEKLKLWCLKDDYTVCILFDDTNYIGGLQVGLSTEYYTDSIFDWETQGFTKWVVDLGGVNQTYWTTTQYYIDADNLATDPEARIAKRDPTNLLQFDYIWVPAFYRKGLYAIPTDVSKLDSPDSDFTKQACIPMMGTHYYYKMYNTTKCQADTLLAYFPLVYKNKIVGLGLETCGKYNNPASYKMRFELPDYNVVKAIVPTGPECLYELANDPGIVTMHAFFIDSPNSISCLAD